MRLLVIGKFYTEGFALHIAETLAAMGHEVGRFEPGFNPPAAKSRVGHRFAQVRSVIHANTDSIPAIRRRRMEKLWALAEEMKPDATIVCHDFLWPEEVLQLKKLTGSPVAMWFPDSMANFGRAFFMNAPYDGLFFKDPFIIERLQDMVRSPCFYLPECFNPQRHVSADPSPEDLRRFGCDITTAGNQHSWRVAFFANLSGYDVKVWGNPAPLWMPTGSIAYMHQGRGVFNEEKALAFKSAKIVVNNLLYGEVWGVNVRCFEAAGVGAFQMVDWRPGLDQLFDDGRELVSFRSMRDLKQKIDYWLPRDAERMEIGQAAKRRALAEHTYELRLQLLIDTLGGSESGFPLPAIPDAYLLSGRKTAAAPATPTMT